MCSYLVRVLSERSDINTCYYFCNSHDPGSISHQVLRTVALQLLRQNLDLASLISNEYVYRGLSCGMPQLRILVSHLLEIMPGTRIVIDGLDECSQENQRMVLKDLQTACIGPEKQCKVLIASRREVTISEKLSSKPQINLDGREEVHSDIRSFVKHKISELRTSDAELSKKIESVLVEKADGTTARSSVARGLVKFQ